MTTNELFSKFTCPKKDSKILLLTHTDLDGSGPAILLSLCFSNVTIQHCSNKSMSFDIKNAICNNEVNDTYDYVFACDISCTADDAIKIQNNPHHKKLILLDHHATASHLNQYSWACVHSTTVEDSTRLNQYPDDNQGLSSGTSLMYDFLEYFDMLAVPNLALLTDLIHRTTCWDTWDWFYIFNADEEYKKLPTLFGIYGYDMFEENMIAKLRNTDCYSLFDKTDLLLLDLEQYRIDTYLKSISKCINTGNIVINDKFYSCVFCISSSYMSETFEFMENTYEDYDLYFVNYGTGISFRTRKYNINVGEILSTIGGGGHAGAGGTKIAFDLQKDLIEKALNATLYVDEKTY